MTGAGDALGRNIPPYSLSRPSPSPGVAAADPGRGPVPSRHLDS